MKTFKLYIVFVLFILVFPPVQAQEREIHSFEDWKYITNATGITLTSWFGNSRSVEIPDTINGISVTELAANLFKSNTRIESVFIPDSVTVIGEYAFHGCLALKEIRLPEKLKRIEQYTFRYCTSLESIELPESLTFIGNYAFAGCQGLKEIWIPDSVTNINTNAFNSCTSLENIRISKNLTFLGSHAFLGTPWLDAQTEEEFVIIGVGILLKWNGNDSVVSVPYGVTLVADAFFENNSVEEIELPSSVTRIGTDAFRDAVNLKSVAIPESVTRIDTYVFYGCRSLRTINIPDSVTNIGSSAFRGCEKLIRFDFPPNIIKLESYVLGECIRLSDVSIPSAVESINVNAFSGSPLVQLQVTYDSEGERFAKDNNISYTYALQQTKDYIYSRNDNDIQILRYIGKLVEVEVPEKIDGIPVKHINTAAFQDNQIVKKVILPDSIVSVGDWAFSYMENLQEVKISNSLISLGADAFTGSKQLRSVSLPGKISDIGVEPFEGIPDLLICAPKGSITESNLSNMNYPVLSPDHCVITESHVEDRNAGPDISETNYQRFVITSTPVPTEITSPSSEEMSSLFSSDFAKAETGTETFELSSMTTEPTELPEIDLTADPDFSDGTISSETQISDDAPDTSVIEVVYIPSDTDTLTPDMLENAAEILTIVIPPNVSHIDESILEGRQITIVSISGSNAENFAKQWNLSFLDAPWLLTDLEQDGA